ncbi:MAG: Hsp33 family molecular chaperone HslO [Eubacteriaceae bacterium]|jgi:molecular chaperone Hsp33
MQDKIIYASAAESIIVRFADTTRACRRAARIHQTQGTATDSLCRVLTGAVLGAALMKSDDELFTLSINSEGAVSYITATASPDGSVKSLIDFDAPELGTTVSGSIGDGTLSIVREIGIGEPYRGSIPLVTGEIAEDLTAYFAISEQTPTSCALGEDIDENFIKRAGGFLIQLMPDTPDTVIDALEKDLAGSESVCQLLEEHEDPRDLLKALLPGFEISTYLEKDVRFDCSCSREKAEQALISTGRENLEEMISEEKSFPVVCPYCKTSYTFEKEDLKNLLQEADNKKKPKA